MQTNNKGKQNTSSTATVYEKSKNSEEIDQSRKNREFSLHLDSVREMIPFLAATGHKNYTKSTWIYHQQMTELQNSHPHLYRKFMDGNHVVRRTEQPFVCISTDLAIKQILMRSIKSNGGLTRGTGLGEDERLVWLMCMPACAEIHKAMCRM